MNRVSIHTLLACSLILGLASAALASRDQLKVIEQDALKKIPKVNRKASWDLPPLPSLPIVPRNPATLQAIEAARQPIRLQRAQLRADLEVIERAIADGANQRVILLMIEKNVGQRERGNLPAFIIGPYLDSLQDRIRILDEHAEKLNEQYMDLMKKRHERIRNRHQQLNPQPQR